MKKLLLFVAALCCAVMVNAQATYQITISPAEGESFNLSVAPIDNIASIKSQIQDLKSIPTNQQVLIFAGKVLKDAKCVADYNIQAGSTVYLRFVAHNEQGALGGKFSVADNKKIAFSQGNLQATTEDLGVNWTWSFATEQYDLIGNAFANTAINGNGTVSTNGTVDLFGWSTSATYYGIHNSTAGNTYIGDFADWGANPISNGGNLANQWRTLTKDEWGYLFNTRTTTSGIRYARATVNNVTGIILLPDDWSTTYYELSNTNTEDAAYASNTITLYDWITTLEVQGAVFLPATGQRNGTSVGYVGTVSGYWSATQGGSTYAFHLDFGSGFTVPTGIDTRSMGYSVRLVKDLLDVTVTSAPEAITNLYYNGTAQELVTAGIADGGEMQYKVDDGEWSAYLPVATEPGEYAVYYRVAGDADHVNSPVYGPIDVSILSTVAYVTTSTSVSTYYADLASALSAWEANSTLTLLADATISSRIDINNTRTLDLNGYGIKMTGTDCIFLVQSGGDLTMIDSNPTRSTRTYNVSNNLAILADGGAYSFQGGYLTGGQGSTAEDSYRRGGAVLLMGTNCRFTMRGGTILGNCAGFGGGVHVRRGKFVMEGGAIIYNSVSQYNYHGGGAVFVDCGYGADLTLGGTALIEHNYANGYENGQVFIGEGADGQLVISGGSPRVINSANTNNLILGINSTNYSIMTITGELTADADLSLYVYRTGVLTSGYDTYHHGVDPNTFFSVQNSEYRLKLNASGEVQAVTMATISSVPSANSGLIYSGVAQELVTAGTANGGEMQYSLDNTNWSADIPTGTDAATYTVYYKVVGDANHSDNAGSSVAITIAKADASITSVPTAIDGLVYNGSAQTLIAAGTANGGEMQYSLDNINWSAYLPTATEGGIYTVYYKVVGDANHNDVAAASLNVTIKNTITWLDGDGNTLKTDVLAYGETPEYTGATPTKTATAQYTFTFNDSWSPAIADVSADVTYTAQFDAATRSYVITFQDENGSTLSAEEWEYGAMPTCTEPTKAEDENYTYAFKAWTPDIVAVTGEATYTATYEATEKPQIPTGLDDTVSDSTAIKRIVNGQLLIEKNGRTFNALGVEVK